METLVSCAYSKELGVQPVITWSKPDHVNGAVRKSYPREPLTALAGDLNCNSWKGFLSVRDSYCKVAPHLDSPVGAGSQ